MFRTSGIRSWASWVAPGGVVTLAAALAVRFVSGSPSFTGLAGSYIYAVYAAAALLAWRFHRSRVLAAVLALAIAEAISRRASGPDAQVVYSAVAFLLPATLGVLCLTRDHGLPSLRGASQVVLVLVQPLAVSLLLEFQPSGTSAFFMQSFVGRALASWSSIPQPALLAFLVAFVLILVLAVRRNSPVEKGVLWTLIASYLAVAAARDSAAPSIYFAAAGLILGLSVVEISYSMAYRDELTGLPARRALRDALASLGGRYAIAMVDVDHFKKFNDRHGHDVGDQVLRMVASRLKKVSGGGRAFRYGGEEFAVIFPGKTKEETLPYLEKLRTKVEEYGFTLRGRGRPRKRPHERNTRRGKGKGKRTAVTVSIGVAERNDKASTAWEVLKAADKVLYRAKKSGRNKVSG